MEIPKGVDLNHLQGYVNDLHPNQTGDVFHWESTLFVGGKDYLVVYKNPEPGEFTFSPVDQAKPERTTPLRYNPAAGIWELTNPIANR